MTLSRFLQITVHACFFRISTLSTLLILLSVVTGCGSTPGSVNNSLDPEARLAKLEERVYFLEQRVDAGQSDVRDRLEAIDERQKDILALIQSRPSIPD